MPCPAALPVQTPSQFAWGWLPSHRHQSTRPAPSCTHSGIIFLAALPCCTTTAYCNYVPSYLLCREESHMGRSEAGERSGRKGDCSRQLGTNNAGINAPNHRLLTQLPLPTSNFPLLPSSSLLRLCPRKVSELPTRQLPPAPKPIRPTIQCFSTPL